MQLAVLTDTVKTMSSRELAELCDKRHRDVKRDIEVMAAQLDLDVRKFARIYFDTMNRQQTEYLLDKDLTLTLVAGYNAKLRLKIVKRWQELESQQQIALPQDYLSALKALVISEEQKQLALAERDHAIATKAEIGSRREATSMATASKYKRENETLKIKLDEATTFKTIRAVESVTQQKYSWLKLKTCSVLAGLPIHEVPDEKYGKLKAYHRDAWKSAYGIDLHAMFGGEQ